jgi:hypothetical protein
MPNKNGGRASKQDLLGPLLAKLGLRADPLTLSILAGIASLLMVFLRRTADSAVISASSALRKVTQLRQAYLFHQHFKKFNSWQVHRSISAVTVASC